MTQYVLQKIITTKQLIKNYTVTAEAPIRTNIPEDREQVVITDTDLYNEIVDVYKQYGTRAKFTFDGTNVTWEIEKE